MTDLCNRVVLARGRALAAYRTTTFAACDADVLVWERATQASRTCLASVHRAQTVRALTWLLLLLLLCRSASCVATPTRWSCCTASAMCSCLWHGTTRCACGTWPPTQRFAAFSCPPTLCPRRCCTRTPTSTRCACCASHRASHCARWSTHTGARLSLARGFVLQLVLGSQDGRLQLWNIRTGKMVHEFPGWPGTPVMCLAQSPAVDVVAVGLGDGRVTVHNLLSDEACAPACELNAPRADRARAAHADVDDVQTDGWRRDRGYVPHGWWGWRWCRAVAGDRVRIRADPHVEPAGGQRVPCAAACSARSRSRCAPTPLPRHAHAGAPAAPHDA